MSSVPDQFKTAHLATFRKARQARDARFDGRFFIGVLSTGIYCRPICPARMPREDNVTYFLTAAAAIEAGYRPCLRCRPEAAPLSPGISLPPLVAQGLNLIARGSGDELGVSGMADILGVSTRQLGRQFKQILGASPKTLILLRRLQFAKQLLDESNRSITEIALAAGYGSVRRFNDHCLQVYGRPPREIRRKGHHPSQSDGMRFSLPYRPPYHFEALLDFLRLRATPGVEWVEEGFYNRTIILDNRAGLLRIGLDIERQSLFCELNMTVTTSLLPLLHRLRRLFDLGADSAGIDEHLSTDERLAPLVARNPGLRLPGAWDAYEIAVRALVGQQISVAAATRVMGRLVETYGQKLKQGDTRFSLFPAPGALAEIDPLSLPMPVSRAKAISTLSALVASGELDFNLPGEALRQQLLAIKGIGPWTADYICMRALGDPDVFLHGDLVLKKVAAQLFDLSGEQQLINYSQKWRPWRAYAALHLWRAAPLLQYPSRQHSSSQDSSLPARG